MEKIVSFENHFNQKLCGILHIPEKQSVSQKKIGINLLSPGLKNRVAPNRLNVKIARHLCELGFHVLRFDPHGIGDSEGDFEGENELVTELWGAIQHGAFVEDTIIANDFLRSEGMLEEVILIAQCGAAVTASILGDRDQRLRGIILIDTPFTIISSEISITDVIIENTSTKQIIHEQINNFLKFNWIKNFSSRGKCTAYIKKKIGVLRKTINSHMKKHDGLPDRFNFNLANSMMQFMRKGKKIVFLFAENDLAINQFKRYFYPNFLVGNNNLKEYWKMEEIEKSNHIYTEIQSQEKLINYIENSLIFLCD